MALHAVDALSDALVATRRYRPRGPREWAWVAVVAAAVGSPGVGLPSGGGSGGDAPVRQRGALEEAFPAGVPELVLVVAAAAVALWVLFVVAGAFLEFPFLRWLRDGDLALREEVRAHWRRAAGLAAFRLLLGGLAAAIPVAVVAGVGLEARPATYLAALGAYWSAFALVGVATGLVGAFTTAFVVPAMWLHGHGVVGGWRRLWPTLTDAPGEFLGYAVAATVLAYVGGLLVVLAALLALVPVLAVAVAVGFAVGAAAAAVLAALVGGILVVAVAAVVYALFQTYFRFYALFVLGDVDPALDVIPERRRAVRAGDGGDAAAAQRE